MQLNIDEGSKSVFLLDCHKKLYLSYCWCSIIEQDSGKLQSLAPILSNLLSFHMTKMLYKSDTM